MSDYYEKYSTLYNNYHSEELYKKVRKEMNKTFPYYLLNMVLFSSSNNFPYSKQIGKKYRRKCKECKIKMGDVLT